MNFAICRIVGNELPPRDKLGVRLECLKYILNTEKLKGVHKVWILNHILDEDYRQKLLEILSGEEIHEMVFDYKIYKKKLTFDKKILYTININAARNFGIKLCQKKFDYTVCLDQDCFFWTEEWEKIKKNIKIHPQKSHFGVISKRIHIDNIPNSVEEIPDEEPMLIFNKTTKQLFDVSIKFGDNDKNRLLWKLGFKMNHPEKVVTCDKNSICAGYVMHMAFGEEKYETSLKERLAAREKGLISLLEKIDKIPKIKFL